MQSLPTLTNDDDLILEQGLEVIRMALRETGVNPFIIPSIIRAIANLTFGEGYGKIQIFMQARVITQIKPEESVQINKPAIGNEKGTETR